MRLALKGDLAMCSGCSGDYAGGFEELGDFADELSSSYEPAGWDRQKGDGNRLGDERIGGFEDNLNGQWSSSRTDLPGSTDGNGAEICEILVSATHIMEIRYSQLTPRK
jgi:hypothetical protein